MARLYPAQKHEKYTTDLFEHEHSGQLLDTAENCITFKHFCEGVPVACISLSRDSKKPMQSTTDLDNVTLRTESIVTR
jgi:hypothetical protein